MSADVTRFRQGCLQCLKLADGEMVPRPLASQLVAEYPGEVLMMDYIKLGLSRTGFMYVLMMVDKFSRLVEFVPAVSATSLVAARAIMRWSAHRGLPAWIISDGGRHFDNTLLSDLSDIIGFDHHITLPYCPWANGSVEVVGKDLCWTLRAMCSEFETSVDEWDLVLPLAEYAINHRRREILGGRSSVEIMTGRVPRTPTDLAIWSGTKLKDAKKLQLPAERAAKYVEKLAASLERMHEAVRTESERLQRQQALRESGKDGNLHFHLGDFVMVAATGNQANIKRHSKVQVKWQGPYEVVGHVDDSPAKLVVKLVGQDTTANVHWRRCRRIAGPGITVTQAVQNSALHDLQRFIVDVIDDWGLNEDGSAMLHVQWRGFDETEATWEPLQQLHEDVPEKVVAYVTATAAPALTAALKKCMSKRKKRGNQASASAVAATTTAAGSHVGQNPTHSGPAAAAMASNVTVTPATTQTHTEARNARAAARAARNDRRNRRQRNAKKNNGRSSRRR